MADTKPYRRRGWLLNLVLLSVRIFGNGVIAVTAPGVTAADAFHAQPKPFEYAPLLYGAHHVVRAGRLVAALGAEHWGDAPLVDSYRKDE